MRKHICREFVLLIYLLSIIIVISCTNSSNLPPGSDTSISSPSDETSLYFFEDQEIPLTPPELSAVVNGKHLIIHPFNYNWPIVDTGQTKPIDEEKIPEWPEIIERENLQIEWSTAAAPRMIDITAYKTIDTRSFPSGTPTRWKCTASEKEGCPILTSSSQTILDTTRIPAFKNNNYLAIQAYWSIPYQQMEKYDISSSTVYATWLVRLKG